MQVLCGISIIFHNQLLNQSMQEPISKYNHLEIFTDEIVLYKLSHCLNNIEFAFLLNFLQKIA